MGNILAVACGVGVDADSGKAGILVTIPDIATLILTPVQASVLLNCLGACLDELGYFDDEEDETSSIH